MLDLVGIGKPKHKLDDWKCKEFLSLEEYLDGAKKAIKYFGPRLRSGLDIEMLNNEDSVSQVAYSMMKADWQYDPTKFDETQQMTRYNLRNNYALYAMRSYMSRMKKRSKMPRYNSLSLNTRLGDAGSGRLLELYNIVVDKKSHTPTKILLDKEQQTYINKCIEKSNLSEKQQYCFNEYFTTNRTLAEIGEDLDLCKERVRQIICHAVIKIKENLCFSG